MSLSSSVVIVMTVKVVMMIMMIQLVSNSDIGDELVMMVMTVRVVIMVMTMMTSDCYDSAEGKCLSDESGDKECQGADDSEAGYINDDDGSEYWSSNGNDE